MSKSPHIVAFGLLTQHDLNLLGRGFDRAFPIDPTPCFEDLLRALDQVEHGGKRAKVTQSASAK